MRASMVDSSVVPQKHDDASMCLRTVCRRDYKELNSVAQIFSKCFKKHNGTLKGVCVCGGGGHVAVGGFGHQEHEARP